MVVLRHGFLEGELEAILERLASLGDAVLPSRVDTRVFRGGEDEVRSVLELGTSDSDADSLEFYVDTAGGPQYFDARAWSDTAFFGPVMDVAADSLAVPADSTAIVADKEIEK